MEEGRMDVEERRVSVEEGSGSPSSLLLHFCMAGLRQK